MNQTGTTQTPTNRTATKSEDAITQRIDGIESLKHHINGIRFAMLTTVSDDGSLRSRPMTTQEIAEDGDLWFFTSDDSEVVLEAQREPSVNLAYAKPDSGLYVSVSGNAELIKDAAKISELWNPMVAAYFPKGQNDPNLALLRITVTDAEVWDSPNKVAKLFNTLKAVVTAEKGDTRQHERINVVPTT
jgi:general stress protein 26